MILMAFLVIFGVAFGYFLYQNSYAGKVDKGYDALQRKEYQTAEKYFHHAIGKNAQKAEAYSGLAETYMEQDQGEEAESVFLSANRFVSFESRTCIRRQLIFMRRQSSRARFLKSWQTARMKRCYPH